MKIVMSKLVIITAFLINVLFSAEVIFQVDMQDVTSVDNGVYLVGYWDFTFHEMEFGGNNIYYYTQSFSGSGDPYQYWFADSSGWGDIEIITREITTPSSNTTLPVVCFNSFEECPDDIEFNVSLSFIDENDNWDNIWFTTSQDDFTTPHQGVNNGSGNWTYAANYSPSNYEWGAYQASDDVGTQDVWLTPNNPNLSFAVANNGAVSGETSYTLETYPVTFTIIDGTETFEDIFIRVGSSDFAYPNWGVQNFCDDSDGNNSWICEIPLEPSETIYWRAFEGGGTDLNGLIGEGNLTFSLATDGSYNSAETTLEIPNLGAWVTNAVIFSVDMTEWLDEPGATGMPIFSVARNDEVQVRGDWNGWTDGNPDNSVLVRQPGTNIFSLPVELSGFSEAEYSYKFYIKHTTASLEILEAYFGEMEELDWGWEDSPIYGGGNRLFTLSTLDGSVMTLEEGYYDLPSGGVISSPQNLDLTYSVDMGEESEFSSGNNVNLVLRDKWTNHIQGFDIAGVIDNNPIAKFNANCTGNLCSVMINLTSPFPWHTLYTWEYKNNNDEWISEGGEFGDYGKYRARYIQHANGTWVDYNFPTDIFQENPPYTPEEQPEPPECCALGDIDCDGNYNVLDIVQLANCVLASNCANIEYGCAADINDDGDYNVLDIVILANCILAGSCGGRVDDASEAALIKNDNKLSFEADGFIGGVQMTLTHGSDFTIKMTDRALFADYLTTGNETRLLVISPETEELFSYTGEFEITEIIVANSQDEVSVDFPLAASFNLSDAYPNPFNPVTTMTLTMPMAGDMKVEVYNLLGQVVATLASGYMEASTYTLIWDASDAASGMYFVKAHADGFTKTQKLMVVK